MSPSVDRETCEPVAAELVRFGEELASTGAAQVGDAFTDIPEADALIKTDPNAFLLGVLFTQGIPAERAWAGPWWLRQRLGHLELGRIAECPDAVRRAVAAPPALHRFVQTLPGWIVSAAVRLAEEYDGDASRIWPAGTSAADVISRLESFAGIGRKKAVMATEILARHFGVALQGLESGSVAYDVHVRRVFLRSGLVERDTPAAIEEAARTACPDSPGTLDLPAWLIGRNWCRPRQPNCEECRLGRVCPRRVDLEVAGVGVRRQG